METADLNWVTREEGTGAKTGGQAPLRVPRWDPHILDEGSEVPGEGAELPAEGLGSQRMLLRGQDLSLKISLAAVLKNDLEWDG